jgi:uncharacterized DUF497 family protein
VKYFTWDDAKNEKLKAGRGIGFEEIVFLIGQVHVLDILEHPNQQRYGVDDDWLIALKTIVPSRKATKPYLEKEPGDHET